MKKGRITSLVIGVLFISNLAFSQFDKASCQAIINSLDFKSYEYFYTISDVVGTSKIAMKWTNFEISTVKVTFADNYMLIKDATEMMIYIPYIRIKAIKASPRSGDDYAHILIRID